MSRIQITGIIHTKNEERYISQAIASLRQVADEIIVADMASTDRTVEIAESEGARVVRVPDFGHMEPALKLSYAAASYDWIFRLDADELLPAGLAETLREAVDSESWDAVLIPWLNFFFGRPLLHSGWGPSTDRHLRLFRKSALIPRLGRIHEVEVPRPDARILTLSAIPECSVWHFNYLDWSHFLEKLDRYTSVEARSLLERGEFIRLPRLMWLCVGEAGWRYIYRKGFKDGYRGAVLSLLMVVYRVMTYAKLRQFREVGDRASIQQLYSKIASGEAEAFPGQRITDGRPSST